MGRDTLCNVNTSVLVRCGACVHTEFMNAVTNAVKVQNTHPNAHAHTPLLASQHRHSAWLPPEFVTATVRVSQPARLARLCLNQCFPIRGITAVGMPSRSRNVAHLVFCLFSSDGWFIHLCQLSLNHRGFSLRQVSRSETTASCQRLRGGEELLLMSYFWGVWMSAIVEEMWKMCRWLGLLGLSGVSASLLGPTAPH